MRIMKTKRVIKNLRGESDRATMSVYVSKTIMNEFKQVVKKIDPSGKLTLSRLMEEILKDFVNDFEESLRKSKQNKAKAKKA